MRRRVSRVRFSRPVSDSDKINAQRWVTVAFGNQHFCIRHSDRVLTGYFVTKGTGKLEYSSSCLFISLNREFFQRIYSGLRKVSEHLRKHLTNTSRVLSRQFWSFTNSAITKLWNKSGNVRRNYKIFGATDSRVENKIIWSVNYS